MGFYDNGYGQPGSDGAAAPSLVADDGVPDALLRMVVINGTACCVNGVSRAASMARVFFTDLVAKIYGSVPANAKYAITKNGVTPVYFTDPLAAYYDIGASEIGKVVLLRIIVANSSETVLTECITYCECQNTLGLT